MAEVRRTIGGARARPAELRAAGVPTARQAMVAAAALETMPRATSTASV
jgi:hypothetical protein